jgi:hypothetical protein
VAQLELLLKEDQLGKADASVEKAQATPNGAALSQSPNVLTRSSIEIAGRRIWRSNKRSSSLRKSELIRQPSSVSEKKSLQMLDYQPAKFLRRQIIRRKFVRREEPDLAPVIAPLPESLQQRCIAAPGLLASDRE